jgi:2,3-diketo-5-methylthiopentyl-1-phosphate enolase
MPDFDQFILPEDPQIDDYLIGTYLFRTENPDILGRITSAATDQTTGTWVRLPGESQEMLGKHRGRVLNVWEVPDIELAKSREELQHRYIFQIAYPWQNFGAQIPMLFTTAYGNISMIGDIKLLDLAFPRAMAEQLPGPQFGIDGIRQTLGITDRPLLNTMIKPAIGLTPEQGANLLFQTALGGVDIIKDDEVLSDPDFSPALRRLEHYLRKLEQAEAETGDRKLYALNVTDEPERCLRKAEIAVANGANAIMVNFLPAGLGLVSSLARNPKISVPILAHHDFGGALYASPWHGISSPLLYGKLARLSGIDLQVVPTSYGKFGLAYEKYVRILLGLRSPLHNKKRPFPVIGGEVRPGSLPQVLDDAGHDCVVAAGGAIYAHPMGPTAGAVAFRQGISLLVKDGKFDGSENDYPELKAAIEKWGTRS